MTRAREHYEKYSTLEGRPHYEKYFDISKVREHYEKCSEMSQARKHYKIYSDISKEVPTSVTRGLYRDLPELWSKFAECEHLNSIPLQYFDRLYGRVSPYVGGTLAEAVCVLKHILLYRVLEIPAPKED